MEAGAPLVLVTGFKLLDMLLEWMLIENGHTSTHKFVQKIAALKGSVWSRSTKGWSRCVEPSSMNATLRAQVGVYGYQAQKGEL